MDKIKASQFADLAYYSRFRPPSRTVTFAAPASTLTNFPALVKCNSTFNIGTSTGYDVHFQDLSGNELAYELDYYDSVTGNGAWWVKIPSLSSSGSTSIKMLYGDSSASTNGSSPLTVWSDYAAVYHLNEIDYSYQTNRATGTQSTATFAQASSMSFQSSSGGTGRVMRFTWNGNADDKTKSIVTNNVSLPSLNYSITTLWNRTSTDAGAQRWFCLFSPDREGVSPTASQNTSTNGSNCVLLSQTNGVTYCGCGKYPNSVSGGGIAISSGPVLLGASFSNGSYRYGQVNATITSGNIWEYSASTTWNTASTFLSLVSGNTGTFVVEFDELRLCKSPHTQDWMAYEYAEYIDHSNNVTYGPEA